MGSRVLISQGSDFLGLGLVLGCCAELRLYRVDGAGLCSSLARAVTVRFGGYFKP